MAKSKIKTRAISFVMALIMVLLVLPIAPAYATSNETSVGIAYTNKTVYQYMYLEKKIGTIYAEEGFTILATEDNAYYVSYSSPGGEKKGYISKDNIFTNFGGSVAGRITANCTVYYRDFTSSGVVGSVSTNEYVAVLSKNNNGWSYIEYNTSASGRKRGFINSSNISLFQEKNLPQNPATPLTSDGTYSGNSDIYRGPGLQYEKIGNLNGKNYTKFNVQVIRMNGRDWFLVYYTDNGVQKSGYIYSVV